MTRLLFGGRSQDFVYQTQYPTNLMVAVPGISTLFWTAQMDGTQITDLTDLVSNPITSVAVTSAGLLPMFYGPDSAGPQAAYADSMWASVAGGPRVLVQAQRAAPSIVGGAASTLAPGSPTTFNISAGTGTSADPYVLNIGVASGAVGAPGGSDSATSSWVSSGPLTRAALNVDWVDRATAVITVDDQVGATDRDKLIAALVKATASGGIVSLPDRTIDVGNGLSLSGYSCGIIGRGAGYTGGAGAAPNRSVIYASTQTGPVLDFTGYVFPDSFLGRQSVGGFAVQGSGVADPTKVRSGIKLPSTSAGSMDFHDIAISGTGGPCLDADRAYLNTFNRITFSTPVGAKINDVPYVLLKGCNGNTFNSLGFRSISASDDTGAGGALVITADGSNTYPSEGNQFYGAWFEYLHTPTNGTLIHCAANLQVFSDTYFVDNSKEAGATGTSHVRFVDGTVASAGGNNWRGLVPGRDPASAASIDTGISVTQSRNRIEGVKGYKGTNVTLNATAGDTYIDLGGGHSGATDAAVIDNSGVTTNTYIDHYLRTERRGSWVMTEQPSGPQFSNAAVPANGAVTLGNGGVAFIAVSGQLYENADIHYFRTAAGTTNGMLETLYEAGLTMPTHTQGLPVASATYRGKIAWRAGAAGVLDQLVVCRKDAADAYAWVTLI